MRKKFHFICTFLKFLLWDYLKCFQALECLYLSSPTTVGLLEIRGGERSGQKQKKKCGPHKQFQIDGKKTFYTLFYHKWSKPCKLLRMHNEFYTSYVKWISMSNSARGTGEPLLIGSEASCIIMDQASLLSHCGSSWITRRERERDRERGRERERKGKQRPQEQAGKGGWWREEGQCSSQ